VRAELLCASWDVVCELGFCVRAELLLCELRCFVRVGLCASWVVVCELSCCAS